QQTYGSTPYSLPFSLNGPCGPGILSAADQGAAGAGGVEIATAGGILSEPALPSSDSEDESDKGGNGIGASTPSGDTAGSVLTSGIAATGAPGGVGGCGGGGASLYPAGGFSAPWIINLLVAFGFLIPARIRRK
ncbi:MAG: hypothetical protein U1D33_03225, partial [bacterium]|nr:hypothetical protein [bacterium]